jgi:MSHA biogenesis protein MshE
MDLTSRVLRPEVAAPAARDARPAACVRCRSRNTPGAPLRVAMADPTDLNAYDELNAPDASARSTSRWPPKATCWPRWTAVYRGGDVMAGHAQANCTSRTWPTSTHEFGDLLGLSQRDHRRRTGRAPAAARCSKQALARRAPRTSTSSRRSAHLRIRFRIDGVLHVQTEADPKIAGAVALRLKLMSGLDISEKRLPQDGRFHVKLRAQQRRRAHLHPAHAARRIGGDAAADPGRRPAVARQAGPASGRGGRPGAAAMPGPTAWCWSPAPPAAARPPRCMPR